MSNSILRTACMLFALLLSVNSNAQSNPGKEKLEKVNSLLRKNKIDAADKKLVKVLETDPTLGEGWDLLAKIRYYQYEESQKTSSIFDNITITTTDSAGNESESDSLGVNLKDLFAQMSPSKKAYNNYYTP